jgi:flagellar biosynthesis protein FliQ
MARFIHYCNHCMFLSIFSIVKDLRRNCLMFFSKVIVKFIVIVFLISLLHVINKIYNFQKNFFSFLIIKIFQNPLFKFGFMIF